MKTYTFHVSLPGFGRVWRKIEMQSDETLEDLHWAIQDAFAFDGDHLYSFFMSGRAWDQETEYCLPEDADPWGLDLFEEGDGEVADELEPPPTASEEEAENPELPGLTDLTFEDVKQAVAGLLNQIAVVERAETPDLPGLPDLALEDVKQTLVGLLNQTVTVKEAETRLRPLLDLIQEEEEAFEEARDVRRVTLEELDLEPKQQFLYLFDYGDEWRFKVRVHAINPDAPEGEYPRLVESVGEAPDQYPSGEEEEEDEGDDDTV